MTINVWHQRVKAKRKPKRISMGALADRCVCGHPHINHLRSDYEPQPCPCGCDTFTKAKRVTPRAKRGR